MITVFCVRPTGFNIGNDAIYLGVRHLLREAFGANLNIVQVPAAQEEAGNPLKGLSAHSIHQMNLYGHGVVVGGGNLYENGGLEVNVNALDALRLPLMLFSLSYGRIYDHRLRLVQRTDAMPPAIVKALNQRAAISVARDVATLEYLRGHGATHVATGGCPSLLLSRFRPPRSANVASSGTLLSIRSPQLTSIPVRDQARVHGDVCRLIDMLERQGFGPVRLLCHDPRDLAFASSLDGAPYIVPDDVHAYLELLQSARLVVTFRLHAFVPCVSFGTPAINISYDERSRSLVRTIGFESWDVNFLGGPDIVSEVSERCANLDRYDIVRKSAQPCWRELTHVMESSMRQFADLVSEYADGSP